MPTDVEIKKELKAAILSDEAREKAEIELEIFGAKEGLDGKSCLQKFFSQWKSGKKGHLNTHNSWAAYYLGLTDRKPNGPFMFKPRRAFARPSPPDIDCDFEYEKRDEIIKYLVGKYGRDRVGNIGTYSGLKMRSALTRIIKALDIAGAFHKGQQEYTTRSVEKVDEILGSLPKQHGAVLKVKDENGEEQVIKNSKHAYKYCDDFRYYMDKYPEIMQHADNIEGLLSIFSVHASGIVLSDIPLSDIAPLRTAKVNGDEITLATQFAYEDLEYLGLIKFDILAISTLSVISRCVKMIEQNYGIKLDIKNLPLDDRPTLDLYKTGQLTGVFQCESTMMQRTCMDIKVDRFEDIMAAISLFRPGPMDSIPEYCARKNGEKPVSYFHPTIEPHVKKYLAKTYGLLVYQEQIMHICSSLAGMTISEGYVVIKGISKKSESVIQKYRTRFIDGCVEKGVPQDVAEQYWDKFIVPFAMYGFNAAHSCAYGYLSYQTAYLKANFPEEFICAYMNVETHRRKLDRVAELERETAKMGIILLQRDINKCGEDYSIVRKKDSSAGVNRSEIRPSMHCKGLPTAAAVNIIKNRPYNNIRELAEKTDTSLVDGESVSALCDAGFFRTKKDKVLSEFTIIREDMKQIRKKGRESINIFDM